MKRSYLLLIFTAVFASSCDPKTQEAAQTGAAETQTKVEEQTAQPDAVQSIKETSMDIEALKTPAKLNEKAPENFKVKFTTTKGAFTIDVTRAWSPLGADRFYNLAKAGFFTDIAFFRVISGFMVQFGIHGEPSVSAAWRIATIKDDPVKESNAKGYISFATAGPGTRTTQMFVNFGDNARLDGMGFSPFGKVSEG
ncbi:MAG: hypothetical protein COT18_12235, partial [Elusimicrobia bacterium CG08_land_8_20_14_0_20_59_10]